VLQLQCLKKLIGIGILTRKIMSMCCGNITPTPVVIKSLMAKTWYPMNFSGFYVNRKSYYKLTGIAIHYKDGSLRWENKKLSKNLPHLLSGWFLTKLWTKTWYLFMDCVTTRLQMEIGFFSVLDPEKFKDIEKIGEILFDGPWTEKKFREND